MANRRDYAWFLYIKDVVSGPFDTATIRERIQANEIDMDGFIWWKGQREWIPVSGWETQLEQMLAPVEEQTQKPIWYIENRGSQLGPLTLTELLENLRGIPALSRIHLWAVGMPAWKSLFELPDIMESLGVSRRANERAPLMGNVAISRSNDDPKGFFVKAASISIEGLGISGQHDLRTGDTISLVLKSKELAGTLHLQGRVAYISSNNYAGIQFLNALPEAQSIILDYVKRFNSSPNEETKIQTA